MTTQRQPACDENCSFPYFAFLPLIAALSALLLLILRSRKTELRPELAAQRSRESKSIQLPAEAPPAAQIPADDLTRIEGIGPKVAATLTAAGITTFKQLSLSKPETIKEILVKAGNRISNPDTWPEQARLAAAGKWSELVKFQQELKGGLLG